MKDERRHRLVMLRKKQRYSSRGKMYLLQLHLQWSNTRGRARVEEWFTVGP